MRPSSIFTAGLVVLAAVGLPLPCVRSGSVIARRISSNVIQKRYNDPEFEDLLKEHARLSRFPPADRSPPTKTSAFQQATRSNFLKALDKWLDGVESELSKGEPSFVNLENYKQANELWFSTVDNFSRVSVKAVYIRQRLELYYSQSTDYQESEWAAAWMNRMLWADNALRVHRTTPRVGDYADEQWQRSIYRRLLYSTQDWLKLCETGRIHCEEADVDLIKNYEPQMPKRYRPNDIPHPDFESLTKKRPTAEHLPTPTRPQKKQKRPTVDEEDAEFWKMIHKEASEPPTPTYIR